MIRFFVFLFAGFITATPATAQHSNTVLWRIESKSGLTSYLFGTVHLAQKVVMQVPDSVLYAINATNSFYGELNYKDLFGGGGADDLSFYTAKLAHLDSLTKGPGWRRMVERVNKQYGSHISPDSVAEFMALGEKLTLEAFAPEAGLKPLDLMLSTHAEALGKKIGGIETMRLQIGMLYDILDVRITDTTFDMNDEVKLNSWLKTVYLNERMDSLEGLLSKLNPVYKDIIFSRRNITMADSIAKICAAEPAFFAIGCGHLVGADGVVQRLRDKGFALTPIHTSNRVSLILIRDILEQQKRVKDEFGTKVPVDDDVKIESVTLDDLKDEMIVPPPPPPAKSNKTKRAVKKGKTKKKV